MFRWPPKVDLPGLPPDHEGPRQAGRRGGADARRGEAPGALRGRRHHPLERVGGALALAEAHERARRHHAHGARRVPRLAPAAPRHARHARHGSRRDRAAGGRPPRRARRALRRPRHRQGGALRAEREGRARRHRPRRDLEDPHGRRADRRRPERRARRPAGRLPRRDHHDDARPRGVVGDARRAALGVPARLHPVRPTACSHPST